MRKLSTRGASSAGDASGNPAWSTAIARSPSRVWGLLSPSAVSTIRLIFVALSTSRSSFSKPRSARCSADLEIRYRPAVNVPGIAPQSATTTPVAIWPERARSAPYNNTPEVIRATEESYKKAILPCLKMDLSSLLYIAEFMSSRFDRASLAFCRLRNANRSS